MIVKSVDSEAGIVFFIAPELFTALVFSFRVELRVHVLFGIIFLCVYQKSCIGDAECLL